MWDDGSAEGRDNSMKGKLLIVASASSPLLCAATIALLLWSYTASARKKNWTPQTAAHRLTVTAHRGLLTLELEEGYPTPHGGFHSPPGKVFSTDSTGTDIRSWLGRFGYWRSFPQYAFQFTIYFPLWWLASLLAAFSLLCAWRWRRAMRKPPDEQCRKCGYNLTGNTSGVCPECGTPVPQKAAAIPSKI